MPVLVYDQCIIFMPPSQAITYTYNQHIDPSIPDIPCYMPDRDVIVPVLVGPEIKLTKPSAKKRDILVLFR